MATEIKKTDTKKAGAEKVVAKKPVQFYFPKNAAKVYRTPRFRIAAVDHVYTALPSDSHYNAVVAYLRAHQENRDVAGGRSLFYEVNAAAATGEKAAAGNLIDNVLGMSANQLRKLCQGDALELMSFSHGELIALYLKQQEA